MRSPQAKLTYAFVVALALAGAAATARLIAQEIWQPLPPIGQANDPVLCTNSSGFEPDDTPEDPDDNPSTASILDYSRQCARTVGGTQDQPPMLGQMLLPSAVAVDGTLGDERIYVADRSNHRVQAFKYDGTVIPMLHPIGDGVPSTISGDTFSYPDGSQWWTGPAVSGAITGDRLYGPDGLAVDALRRLVVGDYSGRIAVFDSDGAPVFGSRFTIQDTTDLATTPVIGGVALSPGAIVDGFGVTAVNPGRIVVTDPESCFVYIYDSGFNLLRQVPNQAELAAAAPWIAYPGTACVESSTAPLGLFGAPSAAAIDAAGHIYISDYFNARVQVLAADGTPIGVLGDQELFGPWGVTVDSDGRVVVADSENLRLAFFSVTFTPDGPLETVSSSFLFAINGGGTIGLPEGIALDPAGRLISADPFKHRIQVLQRPVPGETVSTVTYTGPTAVTLTEDVELAAAVAPAWAEGTVTFTIGSLDWTAAVVDGVAVATIPGRTLATGVHQVDLSYVDDTGYVQPSESSASITVAKASVTVRANAKSRLYGADIALDAVVEGLPEGDVVLYTLATTAVSASPIGNYPITVTLGDNPDFDVIAVDSTLTVTPLAVTVTPNNGRIDREYGDVVLGAGDATITCTIVGPCTLPDEPVVFTMRAFDVETGLIEVVETSSPGDYRIQIDAPPASNLNYVVTVGTGTLRITRRSITVTVDAGQGKVYGADDPALTYTISRFGPGDPMVGTDTLSGQLARAPGDAVGEYAITQGTLANNNYGITFVTVVSGNVVTFMITPRMAPVTIAAEKAYDGTTGASSASCEVDGVVVGDDVTCAVSGLVFDDASVGTLKAMTWTDVTLGGTAASNYSLGTVTAAGEITAKLLTVTITAENRAYNGTTAATLTAQSLAGVVPGETVTLAIAGPVTFDSADAGTAKTVTAEGVTVAGAAVGNYSIAATATTTANIAKADVTPQVTAANKAYDGTTAATLTSQTLTGVVAGDVGQVTLLVGSAAFSDPTPAVGKTVTASGLSLTGARAANYALTATTVTTTANIFEVVVTVRAKAKHKNYGDANPVLEADVEGLPPGGVLNYTLATTAVQNSPVTPGGYPITVTLGANPAYVVDVVNSTLTVDPRPARISPVGGLIEREYGDVTLDARDVVIDPPTLFGDTLTFTVKAVGAGGDVVETSPPGDYSILIEAPEGSNPNYAVTLGAGTLRISRRSITVTADAGQGKVYGETDPPTLTYTITRFGPGNPLVGADTLSGHLVRVTGDTAGTYPITQGTLANSNYEIYFVAVGKDFTIAPKPVTVTITSADKSYDATTAAVLSTQSLAGVLPGDVVQLTINGPVTFDTANAGTVKTVTAAGVTLSGAAAGNYSVAATATTTAAITPAPLTVTVSPATRSKTYGTLMTLPGTGFTAAGLIAGDGVTSVTLTSAGAPALAPVSGSPYAVVASNAVGTGLGNYAITYVAGTLTVLKATPALTWTPPASIVYPAALGSTQLNATASVPGTFVYTPPAGTVLNVGPGQVLSVLFTPTDAANYTTATATVPITVLPTVTNQPPNAVDDSVAVNGTGPVTIAVLGNDTDPDGNTLALTSVSALTPVAAGTVAIVGNNVVFTPSASFAGTATFPYTISDGHLGGTDSATVTLLSCNLTGFRTQSQGGWGAKPAGNNPGRFLHNNFATVYPAGFVQIGGTKWLKFTSASAITNYLPRGGSPSVLTANATNPTSGGAGGGVFAGQVLALRLSVDFSAAGITRPGLGGLVLVSGPLAGRTVSQVLAMANAVLGGNLAALPPGLSVSGLNGIVDDLNNNFENGTANQGYLAGPGCAVNQPPVFTAADQRDEEGDHVSLQLVATDPNDDDLSYSATGLPPGLTIDDESGLVSGTLSHSSAGTYDVTVTVTDGSDAAVSDTFTWTVDNVNRPPDAQADTLATSKNTPKTMSVIANDSDPDGDELTVSIVTEPTKGTVVIYSNGTLKYSPPRNWTGSTSFTYAVSDGHGGSDTATVSVTVGSHSDGDYCDRDHDHDGDRDDDDDHRERDCDRDHQHNRDCDHDNDRDRDDDRNGNGHQHRTDGICSDTSHYRYSAWSGNSYWR